MDDKKKEFDPQSGYREDNYDSELKREEAAAQDNQEHAENHEKPSYYYSYGPYKTGMKGEEQAAESEVATTYSHADESAAPVEVTPPRPVRSFSFNNRSENKSSSGGGWDGSGKKRGSSIRSGFVAFLAGAVVVASLMFAADKTNLFTNNQALSLPGAQPNSSNTAAAGTANKAALDTARPANIAQIFQQASPATVKIESFVKKKTSQGNSRQNDPFYRFFFGDQDSATPESGTGSGTMQKTGSGTGFIFEKDGYILTNEHVVEGADEIQVTVQGYEKPFTAKLLGNSYDLDLAALKIEGEKDFPTLPIGSADSLNVGDWVVAIGNPYGFDHTVTVGVLSAKERPISIQDEQGTRNYKHLLQTDASINPGNSGGPLLNMNGEVIGINTAVSSQAQGIGFAIPESTFSQVLDNLKNNVKIPKEPAPFIGVSLQDVDKELAAELKLGNTEGAMIAEVTRKSPAFQAGMRPYDVIVDINDQKVQNAAAVTERIKTLKVGDKAKIGVMRDGKRVELDLTIGDRNELETEQQKK
ncbi:S1C family serine protease [Paenibacillus sp. FJAT-26967]|uniref:S1C family serine protease n=1 Tax=Paenibacillus sp. FJAT-26967 TaxID=1729690 RepID=UPI0008387D50|nr:trypsin-like peptidase domain-containing protein [Paenibacillus sp. FJAT-26967]